MMIYNNPKVVLRKLTKRYLKENKLLNFFSILAVIFTCVLFTCLFNIFLTMNHSMKEQLIEEVGCSDSGTFNYLTFDEMQVLNKNRHIKSSSYNYNLGNIENIELNKNFTTTIFYFSTEQFKDYQDIKMNKIVGKYPEKNNEIMLSDTVLKQLNIEPKIGTEIELEISFNEYKFNKTFILSGYYEYKKFEDLQIAFLSDNYIQSTDIYANQAIYSLFVNMNNNFNLAEKFEDVIAECGYNNNDIDRIVYKINPAYSKFMFLDIGTIIAVFILIAFILLSGYLIVFNIFNISVLNNIRFYGLLKTIGFTSKQIKSFIMKQGLYITGIALPIGLFLGYLLGIVVLPIIMKITNINLQIEININIFLFAGFFTLMTVYLSLISPAKLANKLSSAESLKVNGATKRRKYKKNSKFDIYRLAKINIQRNRKQFIILILSLSFMPIILNMVITFVGSFNYDSFMSKFVTSDFVVAHYNYFNSKYDDNSTVEDAFIEYINKMNIEESGSIYVDKVYGRSYEGDSFERVREDIYSTKYNNTEYDIQMYGYDDFPLSKFEVINGNLDKNLLETGDYIIEIIEVDDYNQPDFSTMRFKVGDKIDVYYNNEYIKSYTVIAQVKKIRSFAELSGTLDFIAELALPSEEYLNISTNPHKMSYVFNVPQNELEDIDSKLTKYIEDHDGSMQFRSKLDYDKQYDEVKSSFFVPGTFIAILVGFIGIFNLINVLITSIISRKEEFAILNKIGMTDVQRKNMLIVEGLLYTLFSSIAFIILGIIANFTILKYIIDNLWLMKYRFNITSLLFCIPIYLIVSIMIPLFVNEIVKKRKLL